MGDGVLLIFGLLGGLGFGLAIGASIEGGTYEAQAVERGYAQYCPADGAWEWVGECGK